MNDLKTQHQTRARLVREGTRTLAAAAITDYRAAKPAHKPRPPAPLKVVGVDGDTVVELEVTDEGIIRNVRDGDVNAYSVAPSDPDALTRQLDALVEDLWEGAAAPEERTAAYREAVAHATTPKPLPSPGTRDGLLARLNARHHSTRN